MFAPGTPLNQQNIGTTIRPSSTANLLISSKDRTDYSFRGNPTSFTINKGQNILTGFFTRLTPTDIVLDWTVDNVSSYWKNNLFYVDIAGTEYGYTVPNGQYTTAQTLDAIVAGLNTAIGGAYVFSLTTALSGAKQLTLKTGAGALQNYTIKEINTAGTYVNKLPDELSLPQNDLGNNFIINSPKLIPTEYIDFVCSQLTYNQALKDNSTNEREQNIIFRWYFAWSVPEPIDAYGYPIYQGQKRFVQLRTIPYPKQIAWTPNQPVGNLTFQLFTDSGEALIIDTNTNDVEFNMTVLVSEN